MPNEPNTTSFLLLSFAHALMKYFKSLGSLKTLIPRLFDITDSASSYYNGLLALYKLCLYEQPCPRISADGTGRHFIRL